MAHQNQPPTGVIEPRFVPVTDWLPVAGIQAHVAPPKASERPISVASPVAPGPYSDVSSDGLPWTRFRVVQKTP